MQKIPIPKSITEKSMNAIEKHNIKHNDDAILQEMIWGCLRANLLFYTHQTLIQRVEKKVRTRKHKS